MALDEILAFVVHVKMDYRIKIDDLVPKAKSLAVNKALMHRDAFSVILADIKRESLDDAMVHPVSVLST